MIGNEGRVRVGAHALRYRCSGPPAAPPVVLLHGASAHAGWWDFVAPTLAETHRIVAFDLRGHGDSDHVTPPAYAVDDYADDLERAAETLGLARFALVGHSLGGFIALRYTSRHPARVAALALVDARPVSGTGRSGLVSRLQHMAHPRYADTEDAVRRFRLLPRGTSAAPAVLRHVALAGLRALPDGGQTLKFDRAAFARRAFLDLTPALGALACPTLLVRGSESAFLDRATFEAMGAACPHAELAEIAGAHHHVPLDEPQALAARLAVFLAGVRIAT